MDKNYTHICIVLDASGSMQGVESDTKGTFNTFIDEQKKIGGKATLDIWQFADESKRIVDFIDLNNCSDNLMKKYRCNGLTALNDAVCIAIDELGKRLERLEEHNRPEKILFAILTDGAENASREFSTNDVKLKIQHQSDKYGWEFIFLAANQDAFETGENIGITTERCCNFNASSSAGIKAVGRAISSFSAAFRLTSTSEMSSKNLRSFMPTEK